MGPAMASFERVRLKALQLPMVEEGDHRGGPAFKVGKKAFALWWAQGARTIMKLPKARQEFLFAVRPEVFQPCPVGVGVWSFVDLGAGEELHPSSRCIASAGDDLRLKAFALVCGLKG